MKQALCVLAVLASVMVSAGCEELSATGPRIDDNTVKVFLLAGQSNMEGKGSARSLETFCKTSTCAKQFAHLRTAAGKWREREDCSIWYLGRHGKLTVGYGSANKKDPKIGPELQFGHVMADYYGAPVLLIKTAWGGKDLGRQFRSPSRGEAGEYYTKMLNGYRETLANRDELFPQLKGRKVELVGVVWFQGWNDMCNKDKAAVYGKNLAAFIRDLRVEFKQPKLPFVYGVMGVGGVENSKQESFREQMRTPSKMPEFKDTVAAVETAPFYDMYADKLCREGVWKRPDKDRFYNIASDRPYHYLGSGKTLFLIGDALGKAMIGLLEDAPPAVTVIPETPRQPPNELTPKSAPKK